MNTNFSSSHKSQEPESGVLYIVGTPIGNLNDLSPRALNILENVSLVACEDTRQTQKIMNKFQLKNNLISFNKDNSYKKTPKLIDDLKNGKAIALVSDAGMPSICDPGEDLVTNARKNDINIICIPGPCAALTALVSSGLPASKFTFEGFLPKKYSERKNILLEISKSSKTTILYESPHRLKKLLKEFKEYFGGDREIQVSREITKRFEEHIGNNIDQVINYFEDKKLLGEFTVVIKGINPQIQKSKFEELLLKDELHNLINAGLNLSQASKYLAKKHNLKKSIIYDLY